MISYPVDVANTTWAVYSLSESKVIARNKKWPRKDGMPLEGADPDYVMLQEIAQPPPKVSPFEDTIPDEVVDVDNSTLVSGYSAIPMPLEDAKNIALGLVANKRWEVEVSHPTYDTSREAQAQINKAWMAVQLAPARVFNYKAKDGTWQQFTKVHIELIAEAITAWVEDCFDREKQLHDLINSSTSIADLDNIIAVDLLIGWPQ